MIKVLLDTDIGTDVDDAVALAYLLERDGLLAAAARAVLHAEVAHERLGHR